MFESTLLVVIVRHAIQLSSFASLVNTFMAMMAKFIMIDDSTSFYKKFSLTEYFDSARFLIVYNMSSALAIPQPIENQFSELYKVLKVRFVIVFCGRV